MQSDKLKTAYRHHKAQGRVASVALAKARADLAANVERYTAAPQPRALPDTAQGRERLEWRSKARTVYLENPEDSGFRVVGFSDELTRGVRHKGWYADNFEDETFRGAVLQLPGRNGAVRFVAAYLESMSGGYVLDLSPRALFEEPADRDSYYTNATDYDAARDTAHAADSFAQYAAERSRDYDAASSAGSQWQELGEAIKAARRAALAILGERRALPPVTAPAMCAAIREKVESLREEIAEARAKREELAESISLQFADAFNASAGVVVVA